MDMIECICHGPRVRQRKGDARAYVAQPPSAVDAVHVAAAVFHQMEYLLTWNVKHLANPNKRMHLSRVCLRVGMAPPEIVTPSNLWEQDDDNAE